LLEAFIVGIASGEAGQAAIKALKQAAIAPERLEAIYWAGKEAPQVSAAMVRFKNSRLAVQHALHAAAEAILAGDLEVTVAGGASPAVKEIDITARKALEAELEKRGITVKAAASSGDEGTQQSTAVVLVSPGAVGRFNLMPSGSIAGRGMGYAPAEKWWTAGKPAVEKALRQAGIQAAEISLAAFEESCPGAGSVLLNELGIQAKPVQAAAGCGAVPQIIARLEKTEAKYGLWVSFSASGQASATLIERV
jgi:hypothetical protein